MSQKYYQPIKQGTYVKFKSDRVDESRIINRTPSVPYTQVKDELKFIHSNFRKLNRQSRSFHSEYLMSIVSNIKNRIPVTQKQFNHIIKIKSEIKSI